MAMSVMMSLMLLLLPAFCMARGYKYYYARPSYQKLYTKLDRLEEKVKQLEQPVNVFISGEDDGHTMKEPGTHVHVHLGLDQGNQGPKSGLTNDGYSYASCQLRPNSANDGGGHDVKGFVYLRQKQSSKIEMRVDLEGFSDEGEYGFHVHEAADFSNGCNSFGGHFNPYGLTHGGPKDKIRHVGDWGNLVVGRDGELRDIMTDDLATLFGANSIVGRGIVIHAGKDDLGRGGNEGSLKTGNAGPRLACCVIGWAKGDPL